MKTTHAFCLSLALTLAATTAAASAREIGRDEPVSGTRYHTVGFDKGFSHDAARVAAWSDAVTRCDRMSGYMTEFQAGATVPIVGLAIGVRETAFATCLQGDAERPRAGYAIDAAPVAQVRMTPRLVVTASGARDAAYAAVREKVHAVCLERGEHVEHMSLGFYSFDGRTTATAHLACSPASKAPRTQP